MKRPWIISFMVAESLKPFGLNSSGGFKWTMILRNGGKNWVGLFLVAIGKDGGLPS